MHMYPCMYAVCLYCMHAYIYNTCKKGYTYTLITLMQNSLVRRIGIVMLKGSDLLYCNNDPH